MANHIPAGLQEIETKSNGAKQTKHLGLGFLVCLFPLFSLERDMLLAYPSSLLFPLFKDYILENNRHNMYMGLHLLYSSIACQKGDNVLEKEKKTFQWALAFLRETVIKFYSFDTHYSASYLLNIPFLKTEIHF